MKLGFIGSGKMASALMKSILNANLVSKDDIVSSDKAQEQLDRIKNDLEIGVTGSNKEVVDKSDIIFLCVKPQDIDSILDEIKEGSEEKLFVSIAAGVKLEKLESKLNKIVRVMPNTPCMVGEMAAGFAPGKNVNDDEVKQVGEILNAGGVAIQMEEKDLDAVTGLSGSGPAFVAFLIKAFAHAGIEAGLDKKTSRELTIQTFLGTAKLLKESNLCPNELINMVSSPGGTTIAGREVLENSDVEEVVKKTVDAATKRSKELGNG
ncbi:pyrroline-5-carboxylate reductase [Nanoarchaeota archaeon]